MNNNFALNIPVNSLSFGQTSTAIAREIFRQGFTPCIFPIGNQVDLSTQKRDQRFEQWLNNCINQANEKHKRTNPTFKLWHLNGGIESFSNKQLLYSFYELDSPTVSERNVVKNNEKVILSSDYACKVFQDCGCSNVIKMPLGFDKDNFHATNKQYFSDERIVFSLTGKLERRKHHAKVIQAWLSKYGNNPKYWLHCSLFNPFIQPDQQKVLINNILGGKNYNNIVFYGFMPTNEMYNDYLNATNIVIGMSGGEGFGLPEFHSVALGKHSVMLNAHAYKEWVNDENSVLVNPNSKIDSADGMFFHKGQPWNQGNIYNYDDEEFLSACDKAILRVNADRVNKKGLELQEKFTYKRLVDNILQELEKMR